MQALRIEAAGAAPDELEGHRVDAGESGELVGRDPGQPPIERGRQIVADVAGGGRDDVEVVEQPLGGGRRLLAAPRGVSQGDIDVPQGAHVAVEPPQVGDAVRAAADGDREQGRQTPGMFFERLDPEQFHAAIGEWTCGREITVGVPHAPPILVSRRVPREVSTTVRWRWGRDRPSTMKVDVRRSVVPGRGLGARRLTQREKQTLLQVYPQNR